MNKYKLYCQTESSWKEVIASANPTVCPSDPAHTIDSTSISIIEKDILYNDGTPTELTLAEYKQLKLNDINKRTDELIAQGFTFDSKQFGLDVNRRLDWLGLEVLKSSLTFPKTIISMDGSGYSIAEADVINFILTGAGVYKGHIASGGSLKAQVLAATDEAGVDAVVDNR